MHLTRTRLCRPEGGITAVTEILAPRVADLLVIRDLEKELAAVVEKEKFLVLVLDCGAIKEYSSTFFSMLLRLKKTLDARQISLRLCNMGKDLRKGFEICNLEKVLPVYKTQLEACSG